MYRRKTCWPSCVTTISSWRHGCGGRAVAAVCGVLKGALVADGRADTVAVQDPGVSAEVCGRLPGRQIGREADTRDLLEAEDRVFVDDLRERRSILEDLRSRQVADNQLQSGMMIRNAELFGTFAAGILMRETSRLFADAFDQPFR